MSVSSQSRLKYSLISLSAFLFALVAIPRPLPQQDARLGLEDVYVAGRLLEDRNGDGHIDFVHGRIVVGEEPGAADVIAAANIAARLGFETESINLPITGEETGIPIVIGMSGLSRAGIPQAALGVELEPDIGVVSIVADAEGPAIAVVGGSDSALRGAALAFGGRAPFLWNSDGPTLSDIVRSTRAVVDGASVEISSLHVNRLLTDGRDGLRRVDVVVVVPVDARSRALELFSRIARTVESNDTTELAAQDTTSTEQNTLRFDGVRLLRLSVVTPAGDTSHVYISNEREPTPIAGRRPGGGNKTNIALSNLFGNDGLLGDGDGNLIPDRVDVLLSPSATADPSIIDLAARIGLESTGFTFPLVVSAVDLGDPTSQPTLVLFGSDHPLIQQLIDSQRVVLPDLQPGEGWVSVVPDAFEEKTAVLVVGGDKSGERRAVQQLAEHTPNIWERGKDRTTLTDVDEDLRKTVAGRSPVGQAAMAVYKLDQVIGELAGRDIGHSQIEVYVEKADPALQSFLESRFVGRFPGDTVSVLVGNLDVQDARTIFSDSIDVPSEIEAFWSQFRRNVLSRVGPGSSVSIEARLSESPEVRENITRAVEEQLRAAGVEGEKISVRLVSAYKQGFSWLTEFVARDLVRQSVDEVTIRFAEIGAPDGWPQQSMFTPTRWLLEIFPVDEVLAREVGIDLANIRFEMLPVGSPAYEVIGKRRGEVVYSETFEPAVYLRPYFDRFPDYEMSRVTTGWITAVVDRDTVANQRIVTDIEAFWDYFQSETLMRMYDHVMRVSDGQPRASDAPHFGQLTVDVSLSEPDFLIGVDQEQVASMEALHEEIYFSVLHFFDVMGRLTRGQELSYPGRVIPVVRPRSDGVAGHAVITFTGFDAPGPMVRVTTRDANGRERVIRRELLPLPTETPHLFAGTVNAANPGWSRLSYQVPVDFRDDRRSQWVLRTAARNVDARITNAQQTAATIEAVQELRAAGLYHSGLAFEHVGDIQLSSFWSHEFDRDSQVTVTLPPNGVPAPRPELSVGDYRWTGDELVQWETPIPPPEAAEILARMSAFTQANVYRVGQSYLGKDIWAMDLVAPVDGTFWSQAKATSRKPTVVYSARQHANEVSSTSHVLKLAEQILTDTAYADVLKSVNIVVHPITNPDGAQLAYDLYQITPNHMLHAGYLGSLGVDVASGQGSSDPVYPETQVRPLLWNTWLPDLFLNPHGYPSHEWVQIFSEYAGWVRSRVTSQRGWWGMRGWFMPSFNYVDSPDYPRHRDAAFEIRDRITGAINQLPDIRALNRRAYDRYRRYAFAFDTENFKMDFSDSVLIYTSITGSEGGGGPMSNPRVTIWSGTTEAPDETASGDWMKLVASAGLAWDHALLNYLVEGNHVVERTETAFADGMTFKIHRERPPQKVEEN